MAKRLVDELRGASRLAIAATKAVTDLVEAMHGTILGGPDILGRPLERPGKAIIAPVYASIRGVTHLVGAGVDGALAALAPLLGEVPLGPEREAILAALNGVLGDYLAETHNPLAIEASLRRAGVALPLDREALEGVFPHAATKLLVMVHGSSMSDLGWARSGYDYGESLAQGAGYTTVHLHYNSGLHVSTNGCAFADLLERLVAAWPVPLEAIAVVSHSMGGLVARSACHFGEVQGHAWRPRLKKLVCLGTPHHGAPLERGGNGIGLLLGVSRYSAPLARAARIRSAGVTDLRFGYILDEHWEGRDRFAYEGDRRRPLPLPGGVDSYAIAGTTAAGPRRRLPGDGLVPMDSALGNHPRPELDLQFPEAHRWVAYGCGHLALLCRDDVYEKIRDWLAESSSSS